VVHALENLLTRSSSLTVDEGSVSLPIKLTLGNSMTVHLVQQCHHHYYANLAM